MGRSVLSLVVLSGRVFVKCLCYRLFSSLVAGSEFCVSLGSGHQALFDLAVLLLVFFVRISRFDLRCVRSWPALMCTVRSRCLRHSRTLFIYFFPVL